MTCTVHKAHRKDDQDEERAVKIIDTSQLTEDQEYYVLNEIDILTSLSHPNIVVLEEVYQDDSHLYLVFEYLKGGDLLDAISRKGKFSEKDAAKSLIGVIDALNYCHNSGVVHRDIKLENLFYDNVDSSSIVKVGDFGLAFNDPQSDQPVMTTVCGTLAYTAPEIINQEKYTPAVDAWSIGVVIYFLLSGSSPFKSSLSMTEEDVKHKIKECQFSFPEELWKGVSSEGTD